MESERAFLKGSPFFVLSWQGKHEHRTFVLKFAVFLYTNKI